MNRGWLLSAGLLPLIFCTADASAASVSHVVCSKGFCRTVDDCPAGWSEINISGKYLTDSYKYDCTQTFSRSSPVPSDVDVSIARMRMIWLGSDATISNTNDDERINKKMAGTRSGFADEP